VLDVQGDMDYISIFADVCLPYVRRKVLILVRISVAVEQSEGDHRAKKHWR
jgi:hypothetical protein